VAGPARATWIACSPVRPYDPQMVAYPVGSGVTAAADDR